MMWFLWIVVVHSVSYCLGYYNSPTYFCDSIHPQEHIKIPQIMGMWFAIEVISHQPEDPRYVSIVPSCPIIHISEERSPSTYNPLHTNFNNNYNYAPGHSNYNYRTTVGRLNYNRPYGANTYSTYSTPYTNNRNQYSEYRSSTYGYGPYSSPSHTYGEMSTGDFYNQELPDGTGWGNYGNYKKLRLWWDEDGASREYHVVFNTTHPGFWKTSGPDTGIRSLQPQYDHFTGTIQVVKAVADHMVLTFCQRIPDRQLYSVLLSRENSLDRATIYGVHNMLSRKGLSTSNIRKVCGAGVRHTVSVGLSLAILMVTFFRYIVSLDLV